MFSGIYRGIIRNQGFLGAGFRNHPQYELPFHERTPVLRK